MLPPNTEEVLVPNGEADVVLTGCAPNVVEEDTLVVDAPKGEAVVVFVVRLPNGDAAVVVVWFPNVVALVVVLFPNGNTLDAFVEVVPNGDACVTFVAIDPKGDELVVVVVPNGVTVVVVVEVPKSCFEPKTVFCEPKTLEDDVVVLETVKFNAPPVDCEVFPNNDVVFVVAAIDVALVVLETVLNIDGTDVLVCTPPNELVVDVPNGEVVDVVTTLNIDVVDALVFKVEDVIVDAGVVVDGAFATVVVDDGNAEVAD